MSDTSDGLGLFCDYTCTAQVCETYSVVEKQSRTNLVDDTKCETGLADLILL